MKRFVLLALVLAAALVWTGSTPAHTAAQLAAGPSVFEVTPSFAPNTVGTRITITGVGFVATPVVRISTCNVPARSLVDVEMTSNTTLTATVPAGLPEGVYFIVVYNPDGSESGPPPTKITIGRPADAQTTAWAWTTASGSPRMGQAAAAAANNLYMVGGDYNGPKTGVMRAPIGADGALGLWRTTSALSEGRSHAGVTVVGDYLFAIGGNTGINSATASVERARINADGELGPWEPATALPEAREGLSAVAVGDSLYVLGGRSGAVAASTALRAVMGAGGVLGPWQAVAAPAGAISAAAVEGRHIFATDDEGTVRMSSVGADGLLSPWVSVAGTAKAHPSGRLAALNGHLYALGGFFPCIYSTNSVERARINPDGTLQQWQPAPSMLTGRSSFGVAVWNRRIYAVGGMEAWGSDGATVEYTLARVDLPEHVYLPVARR